MTKPVEKDEWWILFRRFEEVVMKSRDDILKTYPNPTNPDVNLIHVVSMDWHEQEMARLQSQIDTLSKNEGWICVGCQKFLENVSKTRSK